MTLTKSFFRFKSTRILPQGDPLLPLSPSLITPLHPSSLLSPHLSVSGSSRFNLSSCLSQQRTSHALHGFLSHHTSPSLSPFSLTQPSASLTATVGAPLDDSSQRISLEKASQKSTSCPRMTPRSPHGAISSLGIPLGNSSCGDSPTSTPSPAISTQLFPSGRHLVIRLHNQMNRLALLGSLLHSSPQR
jgi:hypothetical protein